MKPKTNLTATQNQDEIPNGTGGKTMRQYAKAVTAAPVLSVTDKVTCCAPQTLAVPSWVNRNSTGSMPTVVARQNSLAVRENASVPLFPGVVATASFR